MANCKTAYIVSSLWAYNWKNFEILRSVMICNIVQYIIIYINLNAHSTKFKTLDSFMNVKENCMFVITRVNVIFFTSKYLTILLPLFLLSFIFVNIFPIWAWWLRISFIFIILYLKCVGLLYNYFLQLHNLSAAWRTS